MLKLKQLTLLWTGEIKEVLLAVPTKDSFVSSKLLPAQDIKNLELLCNQR